MVRDSRGGCNRKRVNEDFFKSWTPEMAYVLGFIYADGSLLNTNNSSRTYYIQFSNNDLCLLESIRKVMHSGHRIYTKCSHIMEYKNRKYVSKTGYVLRIGNKEMYQDLVNLGMQHKKSNIMVLPEIPTNYFSYFVRGYFDGDGCISWYLNKNRNYPSLRVLFTSGSIDFLSNLALRLSELQPLISDFMQHRPDSAYNLVYQGAKAMRVLNFMYSELEKAPFLKYKYNKYLDFQSNLMGPRIKKALGIT